MHQLMPAYINEKQMLEFSPNKNNRWGNFDSNNAH